MPAPIGSGRFAVASARDVAGPTTPSRPSPLPISGRRLPRTSSPCPACRRRGSRAGSRARRAAAAASGSSPRRPEPRCRWLRQPYLGPGDLSSGHRARQVEVREQARRRSTAVHSDAARPHSANRCDGVDDLREPRGACLDVPGLSQVGAEIHRHGVAVPRRGFELGGLRDEAAHAPLHLARSRSGDQPPERVLGPRSGRGNRSHLLTEHEVRLDRLRRRPGIGRSAKSERGHEGQRYGADRGSTSGHLVTLQGNKKAHNYRARGYATASLNRTGLPPDDVTTSR